MRFIKDSKGQIIPYIAITILIMLLFASYALSTSVLFLERKKVEDALDAAVLSASLACVREKRAATCYTDYLETVCIEWVTYCTEDGDCYDVCVDWIHFVRETHSNYKNYIYIDPNAGDVVNSYFIRNLAANSKAKIKNIDTKITYDDERFLQVYKKMIWLDPPPIHRDGKPIEGRSYNPDWWFNEFRISTNYMGQPGRFTITEDAEERYVRFPRWVKITATAEVEIPSPLASLIGGEKTLTIQSRSESVQELLRVDKPVEYYL